MFLVKVREHYPNAAEYVHEETEAEAEKYETFNAWVGLQQRVKVGEDLLPIFDDSKHFDHAHHTNHFVKFADASKLCHLTDVTI